MSSPTEPRFDEPQTQITPGAARADWERAELEAESAPMPPRERLFPRRVLVGWALFALAMYFGVRVVTNAVKHSLKSAVVSASESTDGKEMTIQTRKGRVTISNNNGSITISTPDRPGHPSKTIVLPGEAVKIKTPKPPSTPIPPAVAPPVQPAPPAPAKR